MEMRDEKMWRAADVRFISTRFLDEMRVNFPLIWSRQRI